MSFDRVLDRTGNAWKCGLMKHDLGALDRLRQRGFIIDITLDESEVAFYLLEVSNITGRQIVDNGNLGSLADKFIRQV